MEKDQGKVRVRVINSRATATDATPLGLRIVKNFSITDMPNFAMSSSAYSSPRRSGSRFLRSHQNILSGLKLRVAWLWLHYTTSLAHMIRKTFLSTNMSSETNSTILLVAGRKGLLPQRSRSEDDLEQSHAGTALRKLYGKTTRLGDAVGDSGIMYNRILSKQTKNKNNFSVHPPVTVNPNPFSA